MSLSLLSVILYAVWKTFLIIFCFVWLPLIFSVESREMSVNSCADSMAPNNGYRSSRCQRQVKTIQLVKMMEASASFSTEGNTWGWKRPQNIFSLTPCWKQGQFWGQTRLHRALSIWVFLPNPSGSSALLTPLLYAWEIFIDSFCAVCSCFQTMCCLCIKALAIPAKLVSWYGLRRDN